MKSTDDASRCRAVCSERGSILVYTSFVLIGLLLFSGLAVDSGRAYLVKAQLSKAVDGAALAAARTLNSGNPEDAARRIFRANFPAGHLGTLSLPDPTSDPDFYSFATTADGVNIVTLQTSVILPTSFMSFGNVNEVTVSSTGEARRRLVDLSLVLDVSSSIGSKWPLVRDAARTFVDAFDSANDRVALVTYSNGANVLAQMQANRGFNKSAVINAIPQSLPGGSTSMVEGLYRGWDELRTVPSGQQSSLRIILLFTDGASNSVPGQYTVSGGLQATAKGLRTYDFPKNSPDPDSQTWNNPQIVGLFDTQTGAQSPSHSVTVANWNNTTVLSQIPYLPLASWHTHQRSAGIPTSFPLQTSSLNVNGAPQTTRRGLRNWNVTAGRYPAEVFNINNAARNLLEIIADAARADGGTYPIRIYTIGMGELVRYQLGTMPEKPEDILLRVANDVRSPDYNSGQHEGKYYFALSSADVGPAFQEVQSQIIRLSK